METNQPNFRRALSELTGVVNRSGHRVSLPKQLTENVELKCSACKKVVGIRFDVPCGYLIYGTGVVNGCQFGKGF